MPSPILTISSTVMCPHAGRATIAPSQTRVLVGGSPAALITDLAFIAGCPFQVPAKPQPCIQVQWLTGSTRVLVQNTPVLLITSSSLTKSAEQIPQGTAILIPSQTRALAT
jgi:hypothetical protein